MAQATFIHEGRTIDYTPATDLSAGSVVVLDELIGITPRALRAGELGALQLSGVFEFPKETGNNKDIPAGKKVYWDPAGQLVKKGGGGGAVYLGKAILAAGEGDATARVRLEQ